MPTIDQARNWYPKKDPVHGFDHVLRVYRMVEILAKAEGADLDIVRAAALLHDAVGPQKADKSTLHPKRKDHHLASAAFARQVLKDEAWPENCIQAVEHCIRAHRFRKPEEQPASLEARVLFDADKLDAIGAIGVARAISYALQHDQPFFTSPSEQFLSTGILLEGEPHSAYHEYRFKLTKLRDCMYTPTARKLAEDRHHLMSEFFEALAAEA